MINILDIDGFEWDSGNEFNSYDKHNINKKEAEDIFNNYPLFFGRGKNKESEERMLAYGKTNSDKLLTLVFTIRKNKIRIISARQQSRKERIVYNEKAKKATETNPGFQNRR